MLRIGSFEVQIENLKDAIYTTYYDGAISEKKRAFIHDGNDEEILPGTI